MSQNFQPGDFLIFQLESGYALLRLLAVDDDAVWHLAAYGDFFADVESAENAAGDPHTLNVSHGHIALTRRAFESTQVAKISNTSLMESEMEPLTAWRQNPVEVSDRSVRLMLGLR